LIKSRYCFANVCAASVVRHGRHAVFFRRVIDVHPAHFVGGAFPQRCGHTPPTGGDNDPARRGLPARPAGLLVRFLCLTGLRIAEARALKWENVFPDRIEGPVTIAKSGKSRSIPALQGLQDVLQRLRGLDGGELVLGIELTNNCVITATVKFIRCSSSP